MEHACLASARAAGVSDEEWPTYKARHPVRVQWDPERSLKLGPLRHRSLQVGIRGEAVRRYVEEWIVEISEVTGLAREIEALVAADELDAARERLPLERPLAPDPRWVPRLRFTDPPVPW